MIEIVEFKELRIGDIILIEGMVDNHICAVTIRKIIKQNELIMTHEHGNLDIAIEDTTQIVRIGNKKHKPVIVWNKLLTATNQKTG